MTGKNIEELVLAACENNQLAINELYRRTSGKAYFVARRILSDEDQIADILQESYVKAFSRLSTLENTEKFQGWLDTIVINKCKDYLKQKKPLLFTELENGSDDTGELDFEDTKAEFSPEASVDYNETKRLIGEMIEHLPEDQKMCLLLYYYEERSINEIAQIMDCSVNTVKSRLYYARKNIKSQVEELEKKGTKLYCAPLIPFLYWFFRQALLDSLDGNTAAAAAAFTVHEPSDGPSAESLSGAADGPAGSSTGGLTGTLAGAAAGKIPVKELAVKKLLIAAAAAVAVGVGGVKTYQHVTESPERTMIRFEQAYNNRDLDKMMECMVPEIQRQYQSVRNIAGMFGLDPAELFEAVLGINQLSNSETDLTTLDVEVLDVTYQDRTHAVAKVRLTMGSDFSSVKDISLEKVDGRWYLLE